ncbi:hypothetical protein BH20VER3_BH20VER3_06560 [soil metagenome]
MALVQRAVSAPGDLYVADNNTLSIFRVTPAGSKNTFAAGFYQPRSLAFDSEGNLFGADSGSCVCLDPPCDCPPSMIFKLTPDGTKSTFANLGSSDVFGLAFDGIGNLFVSTGIDILNFAPDGARSTFVSDLYGVWALAFDKLGNLYAAVNASGANSVMKFTPGGDASPFVIFSGPGQSITAMAFDNAGNLFAQRGDAILKISPDGEQDTFATGDFQSALAFDSEGNLFAGLIAFNASEAGIVKFAPDGMQSTFVFGPLSPSALAFEPVTEKLRNLSARGLVGTEDGVLIGGFIVGGSALANNAVLVRAIGPSLTQAGVTNALADPTLELHNASGALIASNDDWQDEQKTEITATGLAPTDSNESAIYATLPAGGYTAVVRGANDTTGVALVEVYSIAQ